MSININGYNATFQEFVNFAKLKDTMGGDNAITQRLAVDLTAEIQTVTDFKISQEFDW